MASALTIENQLILACARTVPDVRRIRDLVERGPDWAAFLWKVDRWRVVPLVNTNMRQAARPDQVPKAIADALRSLHHRDVTFAVAAREALRATLVRLSEGDVPVLVLKGAALAALVYPSPTLRSTRAVDLLIHERDRNRVDALLEQRDRIRIDHHVIRIPTGDVWERARPASIESVPTLVLGHEDLLLQLALEPLDVRTSCDVAETCRRYGSAIDWSRLAGLAQAYDVADPLYYALRLARDLVGADVPASALADLAVEDRLDLDAASEAILSDVEARPSAVADMAHPPAARTTPSTQTSADLAVTYDNQTTTDGVGSQLLRIYGLYALSRALDVKYVHTPLGKVGYQGFEQLLTGRHDPGFVDRYNAFFSLPSDDFDHESCERVRIHVLHRDLVETHRERATATGRPVLLEAIHHYGYTDLHPTAFHALRAVSPYRGHRATGPVRVCIHLRRGDNSVPGRTDGGQRVLPDAYYLRIYDVVLDALRRHGVPFVVRLHTEVPPRRYTLYPDTPGMYFWLDRPATVDPSDYALDAFDALPNLETVVNVDAREALDDFATADVLILSLSSLGYLGGLLNPHGLVVYAPWWHPALPEWLVADADGNLDPAQVSTRIAEHLRHRS